MKKERFTIDAWLQNMSRKVVDEDGDSVDPRVCSLGWLLESQDKLFIITPKPELTEFEKGIKRGFLCAGLEDVPTGIIKDTAKELLEIAKKELCNGCSKCLDEYWRGRKEAMEEASKGFHYEGPAIQTYFPTCFHGGPCTNPMHDCINCPRQSTIGINTATGTSSAKVEG